MLSREATNTNFIVYGFLSNLQSTALEESTQTITQLRQFVIEIKFVLTP